MADHDDLRADDPRVIEALRGLADGGPASEPAPSAAVWDRIAAEAFGGAEAGHDEDDDRPREPATVVPLASRRPGRLGLWVAGAAAAVVLLVVGGLLISTGDDGDGGRVASGELERLDGAEPSVTATVVDVDGSAQLQVDTSALPDPDGYYEVWLGTPELDGLISLGPVRPDGTYDLPPGVDLSEFPVVDVSAEPLDGDPTHSSVSLLRGQLV